MSIFKDKILVQVGNKEYDLLKITVKEIREAYKKEKIEELQKVRILSLNPENNKEEKFLTLEQAIELANHLVESDTAWLDCPKTREVMVDVRKKFVNHLITIRDSSEVTEEMKTFRYSGSLPFPPIPILDEFISNLKQFGAGDETIERYVEALFPSTINAVAEYHCFFCMFGHLRQYHYPYTCGDPLAKYKNTHKYEMEDVGDDLDE